MKTSLVDDMDNTPFADLMMCSAILAPPKQLAYTPNGTLAWMQILRGR